MTVYDDVVTLLRSLSMGTVTDYSTRPVVLSGESDDPLNDSSGSSLTGRFVIVDHNDQAQIYNPFRSTETHLFEIAFEMTSQPDRISFEQILAVLKAALRTNNISPTRTYEYDAEYLNNMDIQNPISTILLTAILVYLDTT